jgi:hypothetical protein
VDPAVAGSWEKTSVFTLQCDYDIVDSMGLGSRQFLPAFGGSVPTGPSGGDFCQYSKFYDVVSAKKYANEGKDATYGHRSYIYPPAASSDCYLLVT